MSIFKLLTILALVSFAVAKKDVTIQMFQLHFGDQELDLTADETIFSFDGTDKSNYTFTYSRKAHVKSEETDCQELLKSIQSYIPNAKFENKTLSFTLVASEITGSKMIRRGEFGDVYVILIKDDKIPAESTFNLMTTKHAANGDELYNILESLASTKFLN